MSAIAELLARLGNLGIQLQVSGDRLSFDAPKGAMDPGLRKALSEHKQELILYLRGSDTALQLRPSGDTPVLSFVQRRIRFLADLDPDSNAWHMSDARRLGGPLDTVSLENSLRVIVARHKILSSCYPEKGGVAQSVVVPRFVLRVTDLSHGQEQQRERILRAATQLPYNLERGPLFRVHLFRMGEADHLLLVGFHHIIADAWSISIFFSELASGYSHLPALSPLPIQYTDYAAWQRDFLTAQRLESDLTWWRQQLRAPLPSLVLAGDSRDGILPLAGSFELELDPILVASLRDLAKLEGATLFQLMLATFKLLLHRLSGCDDLIVGSPIAGRKQPETVDLIGCFLEILAIRVSLSGNPTFRELLARVRESVLASYAHDAVPFEVLVEELHPDRGADRHPFFETLFNHIPASVSGVIPGLEISAHELPLPEPHYPLTFYILESAARVNLRVVYRRDRFNERRMRFLAAQYCFLLEQVVRDPRACLDYFSLVCPEARHLVPDLTVPLAEPRFSPIAETVLALARSHPDRAAICLGPDTHTYALLADRLQTLAALLLSEGLCKGDVVAVEGPADFGFMAALLAVQHAGGILFTLDPTLPQAHRRSLIEQAQPRFYLHGASLDREASGRKLDFRQVRQQPGPQSRLPEQDDPAYLFFTSGTTGKPKAVLGTHKGLAHFLHWQRQTFALEPNDRCAQLTALSFDVVLRDTLLPLGVGACLCIPELADRVAIPAWLARAAITRLHAVPSVAADWLAGAEQVTFPALKTVFSAGEPLATNLVRHWQAAGASEIVNLYGPTETTLARCAYRVPMEPLPGFQPVGKALPQSQALVLSQKLRPCGIGETGEVYLRTPFRSLGYRGDPAATALRFIANPVTANPDDPIYRTGDLGRFRPDGNLELLGRTDDQVKILGVRIEPAGIAARIVEAPGVEQAVVLVQEDGEKKLVAYLQLAPNRIGLRQLRIWLAERLPASMVPAHFVVLDAFPLTPNGKVDVRALPKAVLQTEASEASQPPLSQTEQLLATIWHELLGVPIQRNSDFFELGGHSLMAMKMLSRIERSLGLNLPRRYLFSHSRLLDLAAMVDATHSEQNPAEAIPLVSGAPVTTSPAQQRLQTQHQLDPESAAYTLHHALELTGPLDVAALAEALLGVQARHQVLRTAFDPVPRIFPEPRSQLTYVDLTAVDAKTTAKFLADQEARHAFDLELEPLFRPFLLRLGRHKSVLMITQHHIITDAWSLGLLFNELALRYREGKGKNSLPPLALQYTDYAAWHHTRLEGEWVEKQRAWWRNHLAGAPNTIDLPYDHPSLHQGEAGDRVSLAIRGPVAAALARLAQAEFATPFMVYQALFAVLLSRIGGGQDMVFGTPVSTRDREELEGLIGFFVNTVVCRQNLAPGPDGDPPSFRDILARVRRVTWETWSHRALPFDQVVDAVRPQRGGDQNPLFQVMFAYHQAPTNVPHIPGLRITVPERGRGDAMFDLSLTLEETELGVEGYFEYRSELFEARTVVGLASWFQRLSHVFSQSPDLAIGDAELMSRQQRRELLVNWNQNQNPRPAGGCLLSKIWAWSDLAPHAVALQCGDRLLCYGDLQSSVDRLAQHLLTLGVGPEIAVGLRLSRSVDMVVAMLAILQAGGFYVPIDPAWPCVRRDLVLSDSGATLLLTSRRDGPVEEQIDAVFVDHYVRGPRLQTLPRSDMGAHLAYLIYTSGSTGKPKGVMISHASLANFVEQSRTAFGLKQPDRVLQFASPAFDTAAEEIYPTLTAGATLVLRDHLMPGSAEIFYQRVAMWAVTVLDLPTAFWHLLVDSAELVPKSVRLTIIGGEAASAAHVSTWLTGCRRRLYNTYGPTEATVVATACSLSAGSEERGVAIGRPVAGAAVYLLDPAMRPVPPGVAGEIFIGGGGVARGYHNHPVKTALAFLPDVFSEGARLYRSGDRARMGSQNQLVFLGRGDHQIKLRGYRIELAEIEAALSRAPHVAAAAVRVSLNPRGNKELIAYAVPSAGNRIEGQHLRNFLADRLPGYMVPSFFVTLASFPMTTSGKIDRDLLPEPDRVTPLTEEVAPRDETEVTICKIWSKVLNLDRVGIHANFFELGGDSIHGLRIISLARAGGLVLTSKDLFRYQTAARLAAAARPAEPAGPPPRGTNPGPLPLGSIQAAFLGGEPAQPNHFNQALLLRVPLDLDSGDLHEAVLALIQHHDALRLHFSRENGVNSAEVASLDPRVPFSERDLRNVPSNLRRMVLEHGNAACQTSLDISRGPLIRVVLYRTGWQYDRLLVVVHHLAVDGVSWPVLLEDLCRAWIGPRGLPPKTTSFRDWARQMAGYKPDRAEIKYWRQTARREPAPLPTNSHSYQNTYGEAQTLEVTFEEGHFLQHLSARVRAEELLLAALARTLTQWAETDAVAIELEHHGRETPFPADLSRTLGWFTRIFPVVFDLSGSHTPSDWITAVRDQRRAVPNQGLAAAFCPSGKRPQVLFNYLGAFGEHALPQPLLDFAPENLGQLHGSHNRRDHLLEINAVVSDGVLRAEWRYLPDCHTAATVRRLASAWLGHLRTLVDLCHEPEGIGYTPRDFPLANLDQENIDLVVQTNPDLEDIYPLSPLQEGLLYHLNHDGAFGAYFIQVTCELHGSLDVTAFHDAWLTVIKRHPALCSSFCELGTSGARQVVHREIDPDWHREDWSTFTESQREFYLETYLKEDRQAGFDPEMAPMMRFALFSGQPAIFVWSHHHLILDGWSTPIIIREVFAVYADLVAARQPSLPEVRPYRDYITWIQETDEAAAEAYWRGSLAGFCEPTPLPAAGIDQIGQGPGRVQLWLEGKLNAFAHATRLTPFTLAQAAWALLLARYTGQNDVVFGTTVSGRPAELSGVAGMVGLFINTVPVRVLLEPYVSVSEWLTAIHEEQLARDPFTTTPLVSIRSWTEIPGDRPLFESLLVFENYPIEEALGQGAAGLVPRQVRSSARGNHPMTLVINATENGWSLRLDYDRTRHGQQAGNQILAHFRNLVLGLIEFPERTIDSVPLTSTAERAEMIAEFAAQEPELPFQPLTRRFWERAATSPHAVAVSFPSPLGPTNLSYGELMKRAGQLARHLRRLGARPGGLVAFYLEPSLETLFTVLGILSSGAAYLPLNRAWPKQRLDTVLNDAKPVILVTKSDLRQGLPQFSARAVYLDNFDTGQTDQNPAAITLHRDNLAYLIYTSGSTGEPKGVALTHRNAARLFAATERLFTFSADDTVSLFHATAFDFSVWEIWAALAYGGRLLVVPEAVRQDPTSFHALLADERVTVLSQTPTAFSQLDQVDETANTELGLRLVVFGGEALQFSGLAGWMDRHGEEHPKLVNMYGITETTVHVTHHRIRRNQLNAAASFIGRPIDDLSLRLLNLRGQPVPPGIAGELFIGGPGLARGYLKRPALTATRFVPDAWSQQPGARLYRSGDRARLRTDLLLEYLDRGDRQVQIRGYRIEPGEVEAVLVRLPGISAAAVVAGTGTSGAPRLVAYVVTKTLKLSTLRSRLAEALPDYLIPSLFVFLEALPLTENGKLDRNALPDPERPTGREQAPPANRLERFLAEIFLVLLDLKHVDRFDNFFELGGHSILAVKLVNRIQEELGQIVHVAAVFERPTVADLAAWLEREYPEAVAQNWGLVGNTSAATVSRTVGRAELTAFRAGLPKPEFRATSQKNPSAIFVLSPPRCGSTLLRVILGGHPLLFAPPELELLGFETLADRQAAFSGSRSFWLEGAVRALMAPRGLDAVTATKLIDHFTRAGWTTARFYAELQPKGRVLVDKTPSYALDPKILARAESLFENPLYIHLVRDPRAAIASFEEARLDQIFARQAGDFSRRELAELVWTVCNQNILEFLETIPAQRQHRVSFEELVTEPEPTVAELTRFLGLFPAQAMLHPYSGERERMTDGPHQASRMLGDVKFHQHRGINPDVATRWQQTHADLCLGEPTKQLGARLGYAIGDGPVRWPLGAEERVPLSFAQQGLWLPDQMRVNPSAYIVPADLDLKGTLNVPALFEALNGIVARHEVLRTRFPSLDGVPYQQVADQLPLTPTLVDLRGQTTAINLADALATRLKAQAFDLSQGPLLRVLLIRLGDQHHRLLTCIHHIVADGWSMGLFARELATGYTRRVSGLLLQTREPVIQYGDYARWQRQQEGTPAWKKQLDYWKQQLAGAPTLLELAADRPRPAQRSGRGAELCFRIEASLSHALNDLAQSTGNTPFSVLAAGFAVFLARISDRDDVLFGFPFANRNRGELEPLIGYFVNTLVLRCTLTGTVSTFLESTRRAVQDALANGELPFEHLVAALDPERDASYEPLVQVVFAMQNANDTRLELPGLRVSAPRQRGTTAKFDLTLFMAETEAGLDATFEYDTDLFDETRIARLVGYFVNLLTHMVTDADQPVDRLSLMDRGQRRRLLVEWNSTHANFLQESCIHHYFEDQACRRSETIAIRAPKGELQLSYGALNGFANRIAWRLIELGVGPEVRVGICLEREDLVVASLLAVLKAGGAYVPMEPGLPESRLTFTAEDAGITVLLAESATRNKVPDYQGLILDIDAVAKIGTDPGPPRSGVSAANAAYLIYTSGSTGTPKGAIGTHRAFGNRLAWMWNRYPFHSDETGCNKTALSFLDVAWELFGQLGAGLPVVLIPQEARKDPRQLVAHLARYQVSRITLVPSLLAVLLDLYPNLAELLPRLVFWITSGEVLTAELAGRFHKALPHAHLLNLYGMSETAADTTFHDTGHTEQLVPIGRPIANTRVYLLDRTMRPVAPGLRGELFIGGEGPGRGYHGRPGRTATSFLPDPYGEEHGSRLFRTGDRASYHDGGTIHYLGRADQRFKLRGFRIEPGEIESALRATAWVSDAVVIAQEVLIAYVIPKAKEHPENELRASLSQKLPNYMVPTHYVWMDQFPKTPSGKLDRGKFPEFKAKQAKKFRKPSTSLELQLQTIWEQVLDVKPIGTEDNFFAMGGHSLKGARLAARIEGDLNKSLALADLFRAPTIVTQAKLLTDPSQAWSPLVIIRKGGKSTPLVLVHPIGGQVLCYADLIRALDPETPIYALQAQGLQKDQTPTKTIETMATNYLAALPNPKTPIHLAGWSFGGLIAQEMAVQASQQGRPLAALTLIDSFLDFGEAPSQQEQTASLIIDLCAGQIEDPKALIIDLAQAVADNEDGEIHRALRKRGILPEEIDEETFARYRTLFATNIAAAHAWKPRAYLGKVSLILAAARQEPVRKTQETAWKRLQGRTLTVSELSGDHYTMIQATNAEKLARALHARCGR